MSIKLKKVLLVLNYIVMLIIKQEVVIASAGIDHILLKVTLFYFVLFLFFGVDLSKVVERFIVNPSEGRVDIQYKQICTIKGIN